MIIAPRENIEPTGSNIAIIEAGIAIYSTNNAYNTNDVVQVNGTTNRLYEAIGAVIAGVNPIDDVNPTTGIGTYWFDRGATNYARAFDELGSSKCSNADSIYYKFSISDIDTLMISALTNASEIRVVVTNNVSATVIMDETTNITTREVYDWFDWTYQATEFNISFYKLLPLVFDATLEIYITHTGATIEVGHIAFGRSKNFGLTLVSPAPTTSMRGITSKTRDAFGNIVTRRKARYKRMTISCIIDTKSVDLIENRLNDLADTPAIFVGDASDGGFKSLLLYGELKDHDMPISVAKTTYQLTVEGYL
ncbi:MAG: hypothetical protein QM497_04940 [Sulfurimonas sp.]